MVPPLVLAGLLFAAPQVAEPRQHPARALAAAVDLPTVVARRAAADELAERADVGLEHWSAMMRGFGAFAAVEPGLRAEVVEVTTSDGVERTEVFVLTPRSYDVAKPAPLLLAAHGTGGSGRGLPNLWRAVAETSGLVVVAPSESGPNDGYRFSPRERDATLAVLRWARRRFNIDENRVFVTGISRGGHLAWDLALRFPDHFAGIAPMIGGPRLNVAAGQNNLRYLENVAALAIEDLQGSQDDPLLLFNLQLAFDGLRSFGATRATLHLFSELGHDFRLDAVDWRQWFGATQRESAPSRVVRMATRLDEARAFWVEALAFDDDIGEDVRSRISEREWQRLDDAGKRRLLQRAADRRTARLQVDLLGPGRFRVQVRGVKELRLLLTDAMVDGDKPVQVTFGARTLRLRAAPDPRVLLRDFVERFDRTFLPTREVIVR